MKSILFNTKMVRAILESRKTVTRRAVKPQPTNTVTKIAAERYHKPYLPGQILYVRETWAPFYETMDSAPVIGYRYYAETDEEIKERLPEYLNWFWPGRWYPSIHMPIEAARIFLRVTGVRVERLQDCGKGWCLDIEAEGITAPQNPILYISDDDFHDALREEFKKVWNSTIKRTDRALYGWEANPYVWCVSFERISKEEAYKRA